MLITIARTSGPCTDQAVTSDFTEEELEIVKDTLALVNKATQNKEQWYIQTEDGKITIPQI